MSTYEIDDEVVRGLVDNRDLLPPRLMAAVRALEAQIPPSEPDREYLVKDGRDKFWRWDVRQSGWYCIQTTHTYLPWDALVRDHGPVTIYRQVP